MRNHFFNWNLLECTNSQFHSPQLPPSLLPSHTGTRITCTLGLSSLITKHPPGRTTTASVPCNALLALTLLEKLCPVSSEESQRILKTVLVEEPFQGTWGCPKKAYLGKNLILSPRVPFPRDELGHIPVLGSEAVCHLCHRGSFSSLNPTQHQHLDGKTLSVHPCNSLGRTQNSLSSWLVFCLKGLIPASLTFQWQK